MGRSPGPSGPLGRAFPLVIPQRRQHALGQFERVAAVAAGHPRLSPRPHAIHEVLQLRRQLIALAVAVEVEHLEVAAEDVVLQPRLRGRVELIDLQSVLAHFLALLHQRQLSRDEVDARVAFRRPDAQAPLRCRVMRLAVTCATQPFSNSSRAFTMSSCPPNTAAPTADTFFTGDLTSDEQQVEVVDHQVEDRADVDRAAGVRPVPLGLDELRADRPLTSSSNAGLKRSMCPTWNGTPAWSASAISSSASATVRQTGFSTSTGTPALRNAAATAWW